MDAMLGLICGQEEMSEQEKMEKRLAEIEVNATMNDMLNKVSQNFMDSKFEEAILEVANSVSKYVGAVNESSSTLYQDFNKNLKETFGFNMQQIQDTIQTISEELSAAKGQITVVTNKVEDVDIQSRKQFSELNDRMEVERLIGDMVGWVAE
jgi:uncharacterized protein YukE